MRVRRVSARVLFYVAVGGRRQFGPPPTTPLTVPFTSTLSQDFLDLFAHSIPSSPGKAKGSGPSDFPLG